MPKALTQLTKTLSQRTTFRATTPALIRYFISLSLLTLCVAAHAQLFYTTNSGAITITGYSGSETNLIIPETIGGLSVRAIETNGFSTAWTLRSVAIPKSVTSIGHGAFSQCFNLIDISVDEANPTYSSEEGILLNKGKTLLIQYPRSRGGDPYAIPNSVTTIGNSAFYGCSLKSLNIPISVTSIGEYGFKGCYYLTSISVEDANPSFSSVEGVLFDKDQTKLILYPMRKGGSYTIPRGVTTLGDGAFYECFNLRAISVEEANPSFSSVEGILFNKDQTTLIQYPSSRVGTSYTIPDSVTIIGDSAFLNCGLASVTIPNSVTLIGNSAFLSCYWLTNATLPNSLTIIGDSSFYDCFRLTCVSIPNSLTSIGEEVFLGCYSLTSVTIPNGVTSIGTRAFAGCSALTNVTIASSVTNIGDFAFASCTSLASVIIPNRVTSVGDAVFLNCFGLRSVTIPNSVISIGPSAFYGSGLMSVTIPTSVTSIGDSAFYDCFRLTSVTIPNSLTSIGEEVFLGCYSLTSVTIPNGVTSIGTRAFVGCSALTNVTIASSVTNIGDFAFASCSSLAAISVDAENPSFSSVGGILFNKDLTVLIQYQISREGAYTIPSTVTTIKDLAFFSCHGLTGVTIPDSVTTIGNSAFQYCYGLTNMVVGNGITTIGNSAFDYCIYVQTAYFRGNQPPAEFGSFGSAFTMVYYLPGTTGWGTTFAGYPAVLWNPSASTADPDFGVKAGSFGFNITGSPDITVVVEACSDLANPVWTPLSTNTLTGGSSYFSDPTWTNLPSTTYRFRSP